MPYRLRKAPKNKWGDDAYWVIAEDGTHKSKDPIPKERAKKQMSALYIAERQQQQGKGKMLKGCGDFPTFEEYLTSKGIPSDTFSSDTKDNKSVIKTSSTDTITFDKEKYAELMKGLKTKAQYEKLTKGKSVKQPYEEYKSTFEKVARDRATTNEGVKERLNLDKAIIKRKGELYKEYITEYPDAELVVCSIDKDGNRVGRDKFETIDKGECKVRHKKNVRVENAKDPFGKAVNFLTDVADFAVDKLPILPPLVGDIYKTFAPPTSKFSGDGKRKTKKSKKEMEGEGIFSDVVEGVKKGVKRVKDVFSGIRKDYPPDVRKTLEKIGNMRVVSMEVRRDPLKSVLNTMINFVTLGKWNEVRKKYNYDKVFHLGAEVTLEDGKKYIIEKNQTLNINPTTPRTNDTESLPVDLKGQSLTVNEILFKTQQKQGDKFFLYSAFSNNCQDFIIDLLSSNKLITPELSAFVKQPMEEVLKELPSFTEKIAQVATDLGALSDVVVKGRGGLEVRAKFKKQIEESKLTPTQYLRKVKALAKKNGYDPKYVMFSDNDTHKMMYHTKDRLERFGRVGYGDFILWSAIEKAKLVPKGTANKKREVFHKSHSKIKGDWKADKLSPNNLALNLLW